MTKPPQDALFDAIANAVRRHGARCSWIEICMALGWSLDCALRANPDSTQRDHVASHIAANITAPPLETRH